MQYDFSIEKDVLFMNWDRERLWQKYCGFLDLSIEEFMMIQKRLLNEQMELAASSKLGQYFLANHKPSSIEEFRTTTPFTHYSDYEPYMNEKNSESLLREPVIWAHTSGRTGVMKWVPYTREICGRLADDTLAAFILSSANRKGEVHLHEGVKVVLNLPPMPYTTGIMGEVAARRINYEAIPSLEEAGKMEFEERILEGFKISLHSGIDYAASIAVVLAKIGEIFSNISSKPSFSLPSYHPLAILRLLRAMLRSKILKRTMLPKDIWKVKGLVCGGTDTSIYRDKIYHYWGVQPLDVYVSTETCFIAMQGWNKKWMTFVPYSNFYEFIPEEERVKNLQDPEYQPQTVLLDEVEAGKTYELVITNFHGGPFFRYRIGDLIKIVALEDTEMECRLPQMVFQSRADDVIDIAGFARFDEKTLWSAIQKTGIPYTDWSARKEQFDGKPILNIYIETAGKCSLTPEEFQKRIDEQLIALDKDYKDLRGMTGAEPLTVTLLNQGSFSRYQEKKRKEGFDLAHLKPPHVNAPDSIIGDLLSDAQDQ